MNKVPEPASSADKDTKQQILDATVDLIREEGVECVTLRRICANAKVNLALVNYYFQSKDNLLREAIRTLISRFDTAFNALEDESLPPKERLCRFLKQYIGHLLQYPGLARYMMDQSPAIMGSLHQYSQYSKTMKKQKTLNVLREITGEENEDRLTMMLFQLYGAVLMPAVMCSCGHSYDDEESKPFWHQLPFDEQVDHLFDHYFHKYGV
ncbi:TetR/AcrR family transcriptional regulator [Paenibacillus sp. 7124]|uniref:TetR/AcrR family transcriptional regulator n=1 Tax=Paenibacillus apii TaxID=1850370 RepID=A0A6M1PDI7_9BACL|nr:TetR/AcrR family transcriptional regulator [Paenibacillus apii]NGM81370.1 TetR/AcrR family transcriptional regulator [Paenibacillus apii]NJJ37947.1 TetR/AcrR family transcriptional regulator [Paenibacillus apii]